MIAGVLCESKAEILLAVHAERAHIACIFGGSASVSHAVLCEYQGESEPDVQSEFVLPLAPPHANFSLVGV